MNSVPTVNNDDARPEMDGKLHAYFQAEMPKPWPALKVPFSERRAATSWSRSSGRLALAACVALFVAGYLGLSGNFPSQQVTNGVEPVGGPIGKRDGKPDFSKRPMPNAPAHN